MVNIELFVPGQETRCIAEVFHSRENLLLEHNLVSVAGMEFKNQKDQTDGNVLHYIKNSKGTQLYFTKFNKDSLLHKVDDTDKLITVCAENQNLAHQVALIEYTFKTSVHVNDFSNVASTVSNFFY
jgi:hypothetical protein